MRLVYSKINVVATVSLILAGCGSIEISSDESIVIAREEVKQGEKFGATSLYTIRQKDIKDKGMVTCRPLTKQSDIVGKTAAFTVYPGQTISELDLGRTPSHGEVRGVFAVREIPVNTVITSDLVCCKWAQYGKGIPDGPQPEITQVIGRTSRSLIPKYSNITESELKSVDRKFDARRNLHTTGN